MTDINNSAFMTREEREQRRRERERKIEHLLPFQDWEQVAAYEQQLRETCRQIFAATISGMYGNLSGDLHDVDGLDASSIDYRAQFAVLIYLRQRAQRMRGASDRFASIVNVAQEFIFDTEMLASIRRPG